MLILLLSYFHIQPILVHLASLYFRSNSASGSGQHAGHAVDDAVAGINVAVSLVAIDTQH